jgi:HlyD family secretion protein
LKSTFRVSLVIIGLACILAMLSIAGWFLLKPPPLIIQGEVEATQVQVASKISGRVESLEVRKGDAVHKGQLLVTIESPQIRAKIKQAEAAKKAAGARRDKVYSGARKEEIRTALNMWQRAKAAADLAGKTYERVRRLNMDGVLPAQKLDEAKAQQEAAQRVEKAARAAYDMALVGARKEDRESAEALADEASWAMAEAETYLDETRLMAPMAGEVADIIPEAGELITPGYPLLVLVDLKDVWVSFNLREDLLAKIRMGTILRAGFPALGSRTAELRVNYITAMGDFATWRATKASGDFDLKTFEVRAVPVQPLAGLRPGMSAIVNWDEIAVPQKTSPQKENQ